MSIRQAPCNGRMLADSNAYGRVRGVSARCGSRHHAFLVWDVAGLGRTVSVSDADPPAHPRAMSMGMSVMVVPAAVHVAWSPEGRWSEIVFLHDHRGDRHRGDGHR